MERENDRWDEQLANKLNLSVKRFWAVVAVLVCAHLAMAAGYLLAANQDLEKAEQHVIEKIENLQRTSDQQAH